MNTQSLVGMRPRVLLALLASAAIGTSGCSNMTSSASPETLSGTGKAMSVGGHIHGGNQPVSGATVNLYFAGSTHFAAGSAKVATTTSASDGTGSFQFNLSTAAPTTGINDGTTSTFSCNGGNPYVFLVARGGTTVNSVGAAPNPDAAFIAPMGPCSAITANTLINMSEVVTVATMAAIHQYMDPTPNAGGIEATLSADGVYASTLALSNAFDSVSNLVNLSTGMGNAQVVKNGAINGAAGVSLTITPELAKINQLANIISSCINYSGSGNSNCSTIYSNAVPQTPGRTSVPGAAPASTPTDLLTALYNIFTNPTNSGNIAAINALAGSGPYTPTYSGTPTDWTIGVKYVTSNACTDVSPGSAGTFLSNPSSINIGLNGNIWIANQGNRGSLAQINPLGQPTSCTTTTPVNGSIGQPFGSTSTAIDVSPGSNNSGNVYAGNRNSQDIYRFTPNFSNPSTATDIATSGLIFGMAADGNGNIFYSTVAGNLYEIVGASTGGTTSIQINNDPSTPGGYVNMDQATGMIVDSPGRIWASTGSGYFTVTSPINGTYETTSLFNASSSDITVGPATVTVSGSTSTITNKVYVIANGQNNVYIFNVSQVGDSSGHPTAAPTVSLANTATGGGLSTPNAIALDGGGNSWVANRGSQSISAVDASGSPITPSTGYVKTSDYFGQLQTLSIDLSGNIWIAAGANTITEIVGGAVPVYKAYADALHTGRFQTIP